MEQRKYYDLLKDFWNIYLDHKDEMAGNKTYRNAWELYSDKEFYEVNRDVLLKYLGRPYTSFTTESKIKECNYTK